MQHITAESQFCNAMCVAEKLQVGGGGLSNASRCRIVVRAAMYCRIIDSAAMSCKLHHSATHRCGVDGCATRCVARPNSCRRNTRAWTTPRPPQTKTMVQMLTRDDFMYSEPRISLSMKIWCLCDRRFHQASQAPRGGGSWASVWWPCGRMYTGA